jgi:hypothetical protein
LLREKIIRQRLAPEPKSLNSFAPTKSKFASVRIKSSAPAAPVLKRSNSMNFNSPSESVTAEARTKPQQQQQKKLPLKRPASLLPPKEPAKSAKPITVPTKYELPGDIISRKIKEQREARLAKQGAGGEGSQLSREGSIRIKTTKASNISSVTRGGSVRISTKGSNDEVSQLASGGSVRIKSTKPPTMSTFELPGEALSRKKKEAHEARLKAQKEEDRKRREFKARPIRNSIATLPRETAASRARQNKINNENKEDDTLSVSKRRSIIGAHRPSILDLNIQANSSAPRAPGPAVLSERKPSALFHGPSMSGLAMQRTVSSSDVQAQRQRAKEIYNRDTKASEDIEKEKREREAAAKRSREEAAERGRQASREWAERQRLKKIMEGDKGMGIEYGPGGQLGLRG